MLLPRNLLALLLTLPAATSTRLWSYAALGDSYAAGDGAGTSKLFPNGDKLCGRFSHAYPVLISESTYLDVQPFSFHNLACSGATTSTVLHKQLTNIDQVDLVTIQVGGNEVDFFPVVNECIMQWRPFSTCARALQKARALIQSSELLDRYDMLLREIGHRKRRDAMVLMLGYARFFDAESDQCNGVSFSLTNPAQVLSKELRRTFNELVDMLNIVIRASAEAHGFVYIDVDNLFEGHRFCERDVEEPRLDWNGTWFFRQRDQRYTYASAGDVNMQDVEGQSLRHSSDLTRTFHPTALAHEGIAKEIVRIVLDQ